MSEFLEKNYVQPLITGNPGFVKHIEVGKMDLPDGYYKMSGGGYQFHICDGDSKFIGYVVVTNEGIRGSYNPFRDIVEIKNGLPISIGESSTLKHLKYPVNIYKILSCRISDIRDAKIDEVIN